VSPGPAAGLTVPDTALGTVFQRAEESIRRRPLFRDPFGADLAGPQVRDIGRTMGGNWAITVRARVFDDLLLSAIRKHRVEAVLDLGAGLDARPYRLDLPPDLHWIELDSQPTIEYKERVLAAHRPRCRLERHSGDIADEALRERLFDLAASRPALILTEGVLHYLPEEVVKDLASGANSRPTWAGGFSTWQTLSASNGVGAARPLWTSGASPQTRAWTSSGRWAGSQRRCGPRGSKPGGCAASRWSCASPGL
jgi:Leucine carboxyl methyltransferase